jgi:hypothetical protein
MHFVLRPKEVYFKALDGLKVGWNYQGRRPGVCLLILYISFDLVATGNVFRK